MADERGKAIELAVSQIEKQFGKGSIMRLGSKEAIVPIAVISTGAISFDAALGVGGFPRGRVVEVFGPESSGKTTITLQVIAEAQKALSLIHISWRILRWRLRGSRFWLRLNWPTNSAGTARSARPAIRISRRADITCPTLVRTTKRARFTAGRWIFSLPSTKRSPHT